MLTTSPTTATINKPAALADLVRQCVANDTPIADSGIAHQGVGHPPPAHHVTLIQTGGVLEHYTRDLTVRASAGIKLGQLQEALRSSNQFVPIDADDDLTLGEIIDYHVYNSIRVGYGSIRDLLLGLRYIDGTGRDIHVGGRTVKNVAGYDVTRFMVGGLGQFGLIHEATLRTYAIPERVLAVDVHLDDPSRLDALVTPWLLSAAAPTRVLVSNQTGQWIARVGYYGRPTGCAAQLRSLETLLDGLPGVRIEGSGYCSLQDDLTEMAMRRGWRRLAPAMVKVVVQPAMTGATCKALADSVPSSPPMFIVGLPVHGCLFVGGRFDAAAAAALDRKIHQLLADGGGFRVWHALPDGGEGIAPFAPEQPDWAMLRKLKRTMDPHNIFNLGRFITPEGGSTP